MDLHGPADESEWRALFDALPQIVWVTRPDGWHIHFNQQWLDFTGRTLEESLGHGWNPAFHPDDRDRATARWHQATSTGEPYEIEYRLRRHDGVFRWMLGRALPVRDASGQIVRWVGTCTDIEEIKEARAALHEMQHLQQIAGTAARVGGWTIELSTNRLYWSPMLYTIYEQPEDQALDLAQAKDRYLPGSRIELDAALDACIAQGTPFDLELQLRSYGDRVLWVRVIGQAGRDTDGSITHLYGALQDITQRKEARLANEQLARRLSTTLESITDGFFTLDHDWRFTYLNGVAAQLLERDRDELLGANMWEEFPEALDSEAEAAYRRAAQHRVPTMVPEYHFPPLSRWFEISIFPSQEGLTVSFRDVTERRADRLALQERIKEAGALVAISRGATTITDPDAVTEATAGQLRAAMREPDNVSVEVVLEASHAHSGTPVVATDPALRVPIGSDGTTLGTITVHDWSGEPLLPEEHALVVTAADTLRLWNERRHANDALQESNKQLLHANAALEEASQLKDDLLSMASHELRTPLTPIIGFLELLQRRGDQISEADRERMIRAMRGHAHRMLRLVDNLLISNRATANALTTRPEDVDPHANIAELLVELGDSQPLGEVHLDLAGYQLHVDPHHLQQIAYNLLSNAAKYGAPPVAFRAVPVADHRVAIEVSDQGPGVPDSFRERMWDRFEQADRGDRRTSRGTGLGLAIVKLLAEANGGHVDYRPGTPRGAVFTVELPGQSASR